MKSNSPLQASIEKANAQGRTALIPFITAGFPDPARFRQAVKDLDAGGADIIEIGVPFSDPVADGPVVEDASRRVLEQGLNLPDIFAELAALAPGLRAELVLMGYYNPFLRYGLEKFAQDAAAVKIKGVIVPDLPLDEAVPFQAILKQQGIDLIALVGQNTPEERMRDYAATAAGYVYVVSVMGTTGVRSGLPKELEETMLRVKRSFSIPMALGFGLSNPEQLAPLKIKPEALVFGSALLNHLDQGGSAADFMRRWV